MSESDSNNSNNSVNDQKKKKVSRTEKLKNYCNQLVVLLDKHANLDDESDLKMVEKIKKDLKKVKKVKKEGDVKHAMSNYMFFCEDYRNTHPEKKWFQKELGVIWKAMSDSEKEKYNKMAEKDKERFIQETGGVMEESGSDSETKKKKKEKKDEHKDGDFNEDGTKIYSELSHKFVLKDGKAGQEVMKRINSKN